MRGRTSLIAAWILGILLPSTEALAQEGIDPGTPIIKNYTTKDYGAQTQIWSIVQDHRGVMYFGVYYNIVEFDGDQWRKIPVPSSGVRSMSMDKQGTIYVGLNGDLGRLVSDNTGQLAFVSLKKELPEHDRAFGHVWTTLATSHGVYFVTREKIFRWYQKSFSVIQHVSHMAYQVGDLVYVVGNDRGMAVLADGKLIPIPFFDSFDRSADLGRVVILPWRDGKALIVTRKKGMFLFDPQALQERLTDGTLASDIIDTSEIKAFPSQVDEYIRVNDLYSAAKINESRYALGTFGGIVIMDDHGGLVRIINTNRGLIDNFSLYLFVDKVGDLWLGSNNGIAHVMLSSPLSVYNQYNGIKSGARQILHHDQRLYFRNQRGVFALEHYKPRPRDDKYIATTVEGCTGQSHGMLKIRGALVAGVISDLVQIQGNRSQVIKNANEIILSLTQSKRFPDLVFVGRANDFIVYKISPRPATCADRPIGVRSKPASLNLEEVASERISNIKAYFDNTANDHQGDLWLGARNDGIYHLHWNGPNLDDFELFHFGTQEGLPNLAGNVVHAFGDQVIVGTLKGIYEAQITDSPEGVRQVRFVPETTFGKMFYENSIQVTDVMKDSANGLWIANLETIGLMHQGKNGEFVWDTGFSKLINGKTRTLYDDHEGIVWIGTSNGLYRYDSSKPTSISGRAWNDKSFHALIRRVTTTDERVLFQGTYFDPLSSNKTGYLRASVKQPNGLKPVLEYQSNTIGFSYAAPFFQSAENTVYQYQLEGLDKKWSTWSTNKRKEYSNLLEGDYRFFVRAKSIHGQISQPAIYAFSILPPWYRTLWAYIGFGIVGLLVFITGIRIYTWRLIVARNKLREIVKLRTAEVVAQAKELEKLSIVAAETDNAVAIMNEVGVLEWVNKSFTRMYGLTLEQLIHTKGKDLFKASFNPKIKEAYTKCIQQKKSVHYEGNKKSAQGNNIWIQTTLTPVIDKTGRIIKLVAIDSDITALREAQQVALDHAHKAGMADLAINTVHNVGNLLNNAKTTLYLLDKSNQESSIERYEKANALLRVNLHRLEEFFGRDPKAKKLIEYYFQLEEAMKKERTQIDEQVKQLSQVLQSVEDVVTTQQRYAGSAQFLIQETQLVDVVEDVLTIVSEALSHQQIQVQRTFDEVPTIPVQRNKLLHALLNLINNAKEALAACDPEQRILSLKLAVVDDWIELQVKDTGCGIAPDQLIQIFFHGFSTKPGHQGFGLHDAANFMSEMGGKLEVESRGPGQGTTFTLRLPIALNP